MRNKQLKTKMQMGKPYLHMPRTTLPVNLYAGDFLIAGVIGRGRQEMVQYMTIENTKIFTLDGAFYCSPPKGKAPPEGWDWVIIGTKCQRDVCKAERRA